MVDADVEPIDWSLTTWEGARREQLRRWAQLSLEEIVAAQEEMQELANWLAGSARSGVGSEEDGRQDVVAPGAVAGKPASS